MVKAQEQVGDGGGTEEETSSESAGVPFTFPGMDGRTLRCEDGQGGDEVC